MKLSADQLPRHLDGRLLPVYLVFGDEPLQVTEAADLIRHKAREQGCAERQVLSVESSFNWNALLEAGANLSLFGDRRLIDLRIPTGRPGKEGAAALESFVRTSAGDNILLVTCPVKLDRTAQSAKWFTALEGAGATVPVYPVERSRLPAWIAARLKRQGQSVDGDSLQFLADKVEGNLLAAHQEVQKLGLLYPQGVLSFEQVKSAVCDVARYDVFGLADAALAGDAARVTRVLEGLKGEGEDPVLVLWALTREVRIQAVIQEQSRLGKNLGLALATAKVWDSRRELTERCARRLKNADAARLLIKAGDLDRTIKGLVKGDVWDGLLQLALGLALGKGIVLQ